VTFDRAAAKRRLRFAMRSLRRHAWRPWQGAQAAAILRDQILAAQGAPISGDPESGSVSVPPCVAGYWPMAGEADPLPALHMLAVAGYGVALPDVAAPYEPSMTDAAAAGGNAHGPAGDLVFRFWPLQSGRPPPGAYGIPAPPPDRPEADPDLVLVPLLAVDVSGGRLGQGAGFYDRALARLRARRSRPVLAVGWALECQLLRAVPVDGRDAPLDWIVTERRALRCRAGGLVQDLDDAASLSR